ncbi:LuxR family transcriptional regulator [Streptomyces hirsutus]
MREAVAREPYRLWPFTGREDELRLVRRSSRSPAWPRGDRTAGPGQDPARHRGRPRHRLRPVAGIPQAQADPFHRLRPSAAIGHPAPRGPAPVRSTDPAGRRRPPARRLLRRPGPSTRRAVGHPAADRRHRRDCRTRRGVPAVDRRTAAPPAPGAAAPRGDRTAGHGGRGPGREPLTVNRLHRLAGGDLRLLRELLGVLRGHEDLAVPGTDEWAWRGPVPLTPAVREHTAHLLTRTDPGERETLDRLAFAEPLPVELDGPTGPEHPMDPAGRPADPAPLDLAALERLEDGPGLVHVDGRGAVRTRPIPCTAPSYGPRPADCGRDGWPARPRSTDPPWTPRPPPSTALIGQADVRTVRRPWGTGWWRRASRCPPGTRHRYARLRGEVREAAAWAREGLCTTASARSVQPKPESEPEPGRPPKQEPNSPSPSPVARPRERSTPRPRPARSL